MPLSLARWTGLLVVLCPVAASRIQEAAAQAPERVVDVTVVGPDGAPTAGAVVVLRDEGTGYQQQRTTGPTGRVRIVVIDGGPFTVEARAVGYRAARAVGVVVRLGEVATLRVVLAAPEVAVLPDLDADDPRGDDPGPAYAISGEAVRGLPLYNRNVAGLFGTVPQALGRDVNSVSGQQRGFNALTIDGGIANDVFGVGRTPGSVAGAKPISVEAVSELRVLIAPLDVRQGGFSGGMIQAVTASGSNDFRGSVFLSFRRPALTGKDYLGNAASDFSFNQYGFTLGGPVVRNRLHFFVAADLQSSATDYAGPEAGEPGTGVSTSTAERIREIGRTRYGFDPGGPEAPVLQQPDQSVLAKVTWSPGRSRVDLSANWVRAEGDLFDRVNRNRNNVGGWQLARSGAVQSADVLTLRFRAATTTGAFEHELLAGYQTIDETRAAALRVPLFLVQGDVTGTWVAAGSVKNGQGTYLNQRMIDAGWNTTWTSGGHRITAGAQVASFQFADALVLARWGVWTFLTTDAFERGAASRYEVALPFEAGGTLRPAEFGAVEIAGYLQDQWTPSGRVTVTGGVRLETSRVDAPPTNPDLAGSPALGYLDTHTAPGGGALLSPRVGVSYLVGRGRRTVLRGGVGGFVSRPPYAWAASAHAGTGREQRLLVCGPASGVPAPVTDITRLPSECRNGSPQPAAPVVTTYESSAQLPQAYKLLVGVDHDFGGGISAAIDVVQTWTRNSYTLVDANLVRQGTSSEGRAMYGAIATFGVPRPARPDPAFGAVYQYRNHSADRASAVTLSLSKEWQGGGFVQLGYQWSQARDRFTVPAFSGTLNFQGMPVDGSIEDRRLTRSGLDVPHSATAVSVVPLVLGLRGSLAVRVQSGRPYAYVTSGDANADSTAQNDLVYVPRDSNDLTLSNPGAYLALDDFIRSEACLRNQRGRIMARNSCRNPAFISADVRLSRPFAIRGAGRIEAMVDVFNLLNLIDSDWGLVKEATQGQSRTLLTVDGWDTRFNRPIYGVPVETGTGTPSLPPPAQPVADISRWRVQVGVRWVR